MFSLVCALASPASAEGCPPLFGWFTGSTAQSDFSSTCMSAVRFVAFADRPWSSDQGVLEISRFSCMLFLSVRGFSDYAGPTVHSRLAWLPCCLPPTRNEIVILIYGLFAAQWPRPPMPLVYASKDTSRCPLQDSRSGWIRYFLSCRGSCIPYNMPVYPGALRVARYSGGSRETFKRRKRLVSPTFWFST